MASVEAAATPARRSRSRTGCYTCKFRKVRCEANPHGSGNRKGDSVECDNCHRLGFQCRWQAPAAGEHYVPPPKRRRTMRQKEGRYTEEGNETGPEPTERAPSVSHEDGDEQRDTDTNSPVGQPHQEVGGGDSAQYQFVFLDSLVTGSANGLDDEIFDFGLAGEGLDFVPFPLLDQRQAGGSSSGDVASEWPQTVRIPDLTRSVEETVENLSVNTRSSSTPSVNEDNRRLIQHYLDVMKGFAKVDDYTQDTNNLFISAFSESLCFPPLFYAILCFSASHLAMQDSSYGDQAGTYNRLAKESFDAFARDEKSQTDGLLSALFVRVKTVHITGGSVESLLEMMTAAADIVSSKLDVKSSCEPSALTRRIIIRLAMIDARATYYRLGGGYLIRRLRQISSLAFMFDPQIEPDKSQQAIVDLLRATLLRMRVAELELRLHQQLSSEYVTSEPIRTEAFTSLHDEICEGIERWDRKLPQKRDDQIQQGISKDEALDPATYNYHIVSCALHSALLYLHTVYPLPAMNHERSVSRVLQSQLRLFRDPSRQHSPSSILPSSLFLAGICTSDSIRQDWVLQRLQSYEKSSLYIKKTRELLEAIFRAQSRGEASDVCAMMDQTGGRFVI